MKHRFRSFTIFPTTPRASLVVLAMSALTLACSPTASEPAGAAGSGHGPGAAGAGGGTNDVGNPGTGGAPTGTAGEGSGGTGGVSTGGAPAAGGTGAMGGAISAGTGGDAGDPVDPYTLRIDAPDEGASVSGLVMVTGFAPGFVNVEIWDASHQSPPLGQAVPAADGSFSVTIDTAALPSGATTWTVWAWDSPPGQPFTHDASVELSLTLNEGTGIDPVPPGDGGRTFLLGMFSAGSTISSYEEYLGYHPEFTINSSYQDDHHAQCGQPISGLNDINGYPVIPSVFTYAKDYSGTAAGTHDSCYHTLFSGLAARASTFYAVRVDVEFWPHPPAEEFKASFDHIVSIAKQYLPARIKYVFNPNWDAGLGGAAYVPSSADIIGPDAYNNPTWCQGKTSAQCAADKFDPSRPGSIAFWTKVGQELGKPLALPEFGDDYGDGVYIDAVANWAFDEVLVTPGLSNNVVFIAYWDSDFNEDAHLRGRAMTVFQERFGNVPYTGTYWGDLLPTTTFGVY